MYISEFTDAVRKFKKNLKDKPQGSDHSWEHCYLSFRRACESGKYDADELSLNLAFYLASYGMYRGSSFLLKRDYTVHKPVVCELMKEDYRPLRDIKCSELLKEEHQDRLEKLKKFMIDYYTPIRDKVRKEEEKKAAAAPLSEILITKILLGTLGCVPAYDRYFIAGLKYGGFNSFTCNKKSLSELAVFYIQNNKKLENIRKNTIADGVPYPQMKILDMGFWQIGFDL